MEQKKVDAYLDEMADMVKAGMELGVSEEETRQDYQDFGLAYKMAKAIGADMTHADALRAELLQLDRK